MPVQFLDFLRALLALKRCLKISGLAFLGQIQWLFQLNFFQGRWSLKYASHRIKIPSFIRFLGNWISCLGNPMAMFQKFIMDYCVCQFKIFLFHQIGMALVFIENFFWNFNCIIIGVIEIFHLSCAPFTNFQKVTYGFLSSRTT